MSAKKILFIPTQLIADRVYREVHRVIGVRTLKL